MDGRELQTFNARTAEVQFLRQENRALRRDRDRLQVELFDVNQRCSDLEDQNRRLTAEVQTLARRVAELTTTLRASAKAGDPATASQDPQPPAFVKPNLPAGRRRKRPGRKAGHPAALRPMPEVIDVHRDVPLPSGPDGQPACPTCNGSLRRLDTHAHVYEDFVPAKRVVTCFHTASGYCLCCSKRVESRAPDQPPAANLPHAQLGLNALATGVLLRVTHRLPFRQVSQVLADLAGFPVSPGAVTRQVQRIAGWLERDHEQLTLALRSAPVVYADETGWRTDGKNGYLWVVATPTQTLYHIDPHRSGDVIRTLLGETFGLRRAQSSRGTLVSDFYGVYSAMSCPQQKCLTHLLRELKESAARSPAFAAGRFHRKAKRLIKQMLLLKGRWDQMGDDEYTTRVCRLEWRLEQLANAAYDEPNARRIAARMAKHRKALTTFLWEREVEGTNNIAERAIRPIVVARKISGGSRSAKGADAFAKVASLLRTAGQQGKDVLGSIKGMLMAAWASKSPAVVPGGP